MRFSKTLKACLVILCLSPYLATGTPQYFGANLFMKEIKLTKGLFVRVDDEDFEYLNQWKWYAQKRNAGNVAARHCLINGKKHILAMHRFILGVEDPNMFVDHIDHDILNNCRGNLRICTKAQNNCNVTSHKNTSSKYLGVTIDIRCKIKKWTAQVKHNGKIYYCGHFEKEEDAAMAYNLKAIELHGEFANPNKI